MGTFPLALFTDKNKIEDSFGWQYIGLHFKPLVVTKKLNNSTSDMSSSKPKCSSRDFKTEHNNKRCTISSDKNNPPYE